jgi:hypothetical protein
MPTENEQLAASEALKTAPKKQPKLSKTNLNENEQRERNSSRFFIRKLDGTQIAQLAYLQSLCL